MPTEDTSTHSNITETYSIRVAQQSLLQPHSEHSVMVSTTASGINTVEPRPFDGTRHMTSAVNGVTHVLPSYPFYILETNLTAKAMPLPKHMVVAIATWPRTTVMTALSTPPYRSTTKAFESVDQSAYSNVHHDYCEQTNRFAHSKELQETLTTTLNLHTVVAAIRYKTATGRESQIREHACIQNDATEHFAKTWKDGVAISAQYHAYIQPLLDMLSQFESMRDGHFGRITMAKHRIQLLQPDTVPVHSELYRIRTNSKKLNRQTAFETIPEPAQTQSEAPIVFLPNRDETL